MDIGLVRRAISNLVSNAKRYAVPGSTIQVGGPTLLRELGKPETLISYVTDRPGHDRRYAIDPAKIHRELGWLPTTPFDQGIRETVQWYLTNRSWWEEILAGDYQNYYQQMYGNR